MTDSAWYAQCLAETKAWLDRFENEDLIPVHRESTIVAALCGLLSGAGPVYRAAQHLNYAMLELQSLETISTDGSPRPEDQSEGVA